MTVILKKGVWEVGLTFGKIYTVLSITYTRGGLAAYLIVNDRGHSVEYNSTSFAIVTKGDL